MASLHLILVILGLICLLLAAFEVKPPRGNLLAAGLFFWMLAAETTR